MSLYDADADAKRNLLTELLLELLLVNGTPLMDISLDLSPRNSSQYIGVIRVPQRAGLLPRLIRSRRDLAVFNKWVSKNYSRNVSYRSHRIHKSSHWLMSEGYFSLFCGFSSKNRNVFFL